MGAISTKVAGVTLKNSDGTNRQEILASIAQYDYLELRDSASEKYPEASASTTRRAGKWGICQRA